MLIGVTGACCAGKETFAEWLCQKHNFTRILIRRDEIDYQRHDNQLCFTIKELGDFILAENRWKDNYVAYPIENLEQLGILRKRPFFMCVSIEAPVLVRFNRYRSRNPDASLQDFLEETESYSMNPLTQLIPSKHADITLYNPYLSIETFYESCSAYEPSLADPIRLRPSWDDYFMLLADLASHRSNCMKRRVGCILVKDCRVIATGYNGTPRGTRNCLDGGCKRCNDGAKCAQGLSECVCMHAEENALLEAGRERITGNGNSKVTLYCNTCPCLSCATKIVQCGIHEVVYRMEYGMDEMSSRLFQEAGVHLRRHLPIFCLNITAELSNSKFSNIINK